MKMSRREHVRLISLSHFSRVLPAALCISRLRFFLGCVVETLSQVRMFVEQLYCIPPRKSCCSCRRGNPVGPPHLTSGKG